MPLSRQSADPVFATYRENVRWEAGGVLFVGINLTGSDNNFHGTTRAGGPVPEFVQRGAANQVWLAQSFDSRPDPGPPRRRQTERPWH